MDESDRATEAEENQRKDALAKRKPVPIATGFCLNCGIETNKDHCFCDPDCRDDWELAQEARRRNGNG